MKENRSLLRLDVKDFLEIRPLKEPVGKIKGFSQNISFMGICFFTPLEWQKGQVLVIDYFIAGEQDSVELKVVVSWSEFISSQNGYFCGGQLMNMSGKGQEAFVRYYFTKLKEQYE
jgi:hypothetical protein